MNWENCIYCGGNINNESASFCGVHYYHKVCWKSNFYQLNQINCEECFHLCLKNNSNECIRCFKTLQSKHKSFCTECYTNTDVKVIIDDFKCFSCLYCSKIDYIGNLNYIQGEKDEMIGSLCDECGNYFKCSKCDQIIGNDGHLCLSSSCISDSNCFKILTKEVRECHNSYQIYQERLLKYNQKHDLKFHCKGCGTDLDSTKISPTCLALNYYCEVCKWNPSILQCQVQCECENCQSLNNHIRSIRKCITCQNLVSDFKDSDCQKISICSNCTISYFQYFVFAVRDCYFSSCNLCKIEYEKYQYMFKCRLCKTNLNADALRVVCPYLNYFCSDCFTVQQIFDEKIECDCAYCFDVKRYLYSFKKCCQCQIFKINYKQICQKVFVCDECSQTLDQKRIKIIYDCSRSGCKYCEKESQLFRWLFKCKLCEIQLDTKNLELVCYESNFFCFNCERNPSITNFDYSHSCDNCTKIYYRINHSIICQTCKMLSDNYQTSICKKWEMCLDCIESDVQSYIERLILCYMQNCSLCLNTLCECIHTCSGCKEMNYFPLQNKCLNSKHYCKACLYNESKLEKVIEICSCPYCNSDFEEILVKLEEKSNCNNLIIERIKERLKELKLRANENVKKQNDAQVKTYDVFAALNCVNCKEVSNFALTCNHNQCYTCLIKKNLPTYYEFVKRIIDKNLSQIKNKFIIKCCAENCNFEFNLPSCILLENNVKLFSKAQEEVISEFIPYLDGLSLEFTLCRCPHNTKIIAKINDCILGCSQCQPAPSISNF